ncbi:MAG: hypothetical protein J6K85_00715 [Clostridia bacterium]|nr:hypothetical protein [Clostridia bacterium]
MKKILALLLIFVITLGMTGCGWLFGGSDYDFSYASPEQYSSGNTTLEDASKLAKIHLSWYSGNVTIETHDSPSLIIEETASGVSDDAHKVHYSYQSLGDGDVLFVAFGESGVKNYDGMKKDLKITLPQNDDYYLGVTSDSANISIDFGTYENTLDKLSITTNCGAVRASIDSAKTVQIAGYNDDIGSSENRIYELNAKGAVYSLGLNSSYAKVAFSAEEVGGMDTVGSVYNETHFIVNKANVVKISCTKGTTFIKVNEFNSMDLTMCEKPVYISIPQDSEFTLNKTLEKAFDDELVSDIIDIGFDGAEKVSDNKYTVGSGKCAINILTHNEIHINPIEE